MFIRRRNRILLAVSAAIALVDITFVYANNKMAEEAMMDGLARTGEELKAAFDTSLNQTYENMLAMATFIANDAHVRGLFANGVEAVEAEGGGPGGKEAATLRAALYEDVGANWQKVQSQFDVRQLHFHLSPGSTSYLRVHKPEKFGDEMHTVRHTVVDVNATLKPVIGFETGRVYSGLRGVVPVYAPDTETGPGRHVGALEVGTSFESLAKIIDQRQGTGVGILLTMDHLKSAMWPDYVKSRFKDGEGSCGCAVETASRQGFSDVINTVRGLGGRFRDGGQSLVQINGQDVAVNYFPIQDYIGQKQPAREDVGAVVFWRDASAMTEALQSTITFNIAFGLGGFLLVEILLVVAFRLITARLDQAVAERTAKAQGVAEALARSNEELERFTHVASHDLREPLRMVASYVKLIRTRYQDKLDADGQEFLGYAQDGAERMSAMINDLLALARVNGQGQPFARFSSKAALDLALLHLSVASKEAGADIRQEGSWPEIEGEKGQIARLLQNLIGNALKYRDAERSPIIEVTCTEADGKIQISVSDNGVGFDPSQAHTVFDPFRRLHREAHFDGTGMGLAICQKIVQRHGGEIWAESKPGDGSRFTFTLPVSQREDGSTV